MNWGDSFAALGMKAPSLRSGYKKPRRYEDRGLSVTVMKRKSLLSITLHKNRFNGHGLVFFQKVLDLLKTGLLNKKRKLIGR